MAKFSDGVNSASAKMYNTVSGLIQNNVMEAQRKDYVGLAETTLLASHGALAGIELVSMMIAKKPVLTKEQIAISGQDIAVSLITPETMMFAALLVASMHKGTVEIADSKGMTNTEFGPSVFLEAMQAFEKVMGFKPDKFLDSGLVAAAREMEVDSDKPFAAFLAAEQESKNKPLN